MRRALFLAAVLVVFNFAFRVVLGGQAEHVVIVVWDGMRPDFVTEQYTPTLHRLAKRGTFFRNHHSTYVTSTEVNGAAIATGAYPSSSGILANIQHRPELSWVGSYATEGFDAIRRGDLLFDGGYLQVATLPEILQSAGIRTITAGAKAVVLLHDRAVRKNNLGDILFRGKTLPRSVLAELESDPRIGPFPEDPKGDSRLEKALNAVRKGRDKAFTWLNGRPPRTPLARRIDAWTTRAVIHRFWKDAVPKYTLLWLSEPDSAQHANSPGSPNALVGLESSDRNLALVIHALKERGVLDRTDILVVSDHGFSSVQRGPDVIKALKAAKFVAGKEFDNPEAGDVMVITLGGSIFFYVFEHHEPTIQRLVEFLQGSEFAGVVFTRVAVPGTFPLSHVRLDAGTNAPDVVVSMRWSADNNDWGIPGMVATSALRRGAGTHASLSRFDVRNTLIAAGPDFKSGYVSDLPSGNIDVTPTVLAILGVSPPKPLDGRVLSEAMTDAQAAPLEAKTETFEASRDLGARRWHQYLKVSRVGNVLYFDEGNGESKMK